jgi:hypothetical protein
MPTCASWIIDTSFAPSPIDSVIGVGTTYICTIRASPSAAAADDGRRERPTA